MERFGSPYWIVDRIARYSAVGNGRNGARRHHPGTARRRAWTIAVDHSPGRRRTASTARTMPYFGSFGRPSTISPTMFFWIWDEPA